MVTLIVRISRTYLQVTAFAECQFQLAFLAGFGRPNFYYSGAVDSGFSAVFSTYSHLVRSGCRTSNRENHVTHAVRAQHCAHPWHCFCMFSSCHASHVCVHHPVLAPYLSRVFFLFFYYFFIFFPFFSSVSNISVCMVDTLRSSVLPARCRLVIPVPFQYRNVSRRYTFFPLATDPRGHVTPTPVHAACLYSAPGFVCSPFRDPFWFLWSANNVSQSYISQVRNFCRISVSPQHGRFHFWP